jgi:hypothetical protein
MKKGPFVLYSFARTPAGDTASTGLAVISRPVVWRQGKST